MSPSKIPALGYALLGLLQENPYSGYDLRHFFSSTSMKTYSDSPGSIYPALGRLEKQGLIRGTVEQGSGLRRRQIFRLTPKGLSELRQWITPAPEAAKASKLEFGSRASTPARPAPATRLAMPTPITAVLAAKQPGPAKQPGGRGAVLAFVNVGRGYDVGDSP